MSDMNKPLNDMLKKIRENPYDLAALGFCDVEQQQELLDNLINALEVVEKIISDNYDDILLKQQMKAEDSTVDYLEYK